MPSPRETDPTEDERMAGQRSAAFIDALRALEAEGNVEAIASLFTDDAELSTPTDTAPHRGTSGARTFWENYRRTFAEIDSEFRHVIETDDTAVLEWTSHGRTSNGREIRYDGVSVLEFRDGAIRRFRNYYNPSRLGDQLGPAA